MTIELMRKRQKRTRRSPTKLGRYTRYSRIRRRRVPTIRMARETQSTINKSFRNPRSEATRSAEFRV